MRISLKQGLTTALMAAVIAATAAPAFADRDDWHHRDRDHDRDWHHHYHRPPPPVIYRPGYVYAPPPVVYVRPPPPPPPLVPSFNIVIPLR